MRMHALAGAVFALSVAFGGTRAASAHARAPGRGRAHEADSYNPPAAGSPPPATVSPFNQALLANIERLRLSVDRIVATHYPADGHLVTVAELRRMVGAN